MKTPVFCFARSVRSRSLFAAAVAPIFVDGGLLARSRQSIDEGMLRREHHVRRAEQRVGPRRINPQHVFARLFWKARPVRVRFHSSKALGVGFRAFADEEIDFGPFAAADPVPLQRLDRLAPIQFVQFLQQPVGVFGDAQHPLAERNALTGWPPRSLLPSMTSSFAKHRPQRLAPIHGCEALVSQAVFVLIPANGLGPLFADVSGNRQLGDRPTATLALASVDPDHSQSRSYQVSNSTRKIH